MTLPKLTLKDKDSYLSVSNYYEASLKDCVLRSEELSKTFLTEESKQDSTLIWLDCNHFYWWAGAIVCKPIVNSPRFLELHLAIKREYIQDIPIYMELAAIWARVQGYLPMTIVPDNQPAVRRFVEKRLDHIATRSTSTIRSKGEDVQTTIYTQPENWKPRYLKDIEITWS